MNLRNFAPAFLIVLALFSAPVFGQQKVNFEKEILPILKKSCMDCHKAPYEEDGRLKKPKAGLRLDGAWAITMGSENGAVVDPGKADESELFIRVTLDPDDDDFMPPSGKADPLTEKEVAVFKKWIDEGADFGGWAGNLEGKPKEVTNTGKEIPVSEIQEIYTKLGDGLKPMEEKAWEPVTAAGGRVMPLSDSSPLLEVDFRLTAEDANDEKVGSISTVASNVAHLDLSRSQITDAALDQIAELDKLVKLKLDQTGVTDAGLAKLKGLKNLRYLNLYGTKVTDKGLDHLKDMKSLRSVYLWNSGATEAGAKKLQKALPDAKVNIK
ncbi:MAG: hypothetical protein HKN23_18715 [Verrucomicrobiales bacterium]|nr:hypothetical protein [Verrucomicrobiales bacterium]